MALTKKEQDQIDTLIKGNTEIHTVLVGLNGEGGLLKKVDRMADKHDELAKSHGVLKRKVYVAAAIATAGYGGVTAFVAKLLNGG